jgi:hypothetical protein
MLIEDQVPVSVFEEISGRKVKKITKNKIEFMEPWDINPNIRYIKVKGR